MLVNSRMLPWQQNEIQYHINQHTPSDSVQMSQAVITSFFLSAFLSIYLIYLFFPSFLTFVLSVPFSSFLFPLLVLFPSTGLYLFCNLFFPCLLRASLIYSFSFSLLSSILYFFLHFRKFLNTLNLHFYIKKTQNIGWTENHSSRLNSELKVKSLSNADMPGLMGRYCWWI